MANSLVRQQPLTEWVELVDLLDSKSLENIARIYNTLPYDNDASLERRMAYKRELDAKMVELEGHMSGDAQTGGVVWTPTTQKGESN